MPSEGKGRRKAVWDEYAGRFVYESKAEILQRMCNQRQQTTKTQNNGEARKKEHRQRQDENAFNLFEKKLITEMDEVIETQRSVVAHKVVLAKIATVNQHDPEWEDNLGSYAGASHADLQPLIERQKTKLTASHRRKKAAEKLLRERKKMEILDRNVDTDTLLAEWKARKSRSLAGSRPAPKLILPPIQVSKTGKDVTQSEPVGDLSSRIEERLLPTDDISRPVFLTEKTFYE